MAASQAMTRTGMVVGTPEYMAPEQARGVRELSPAADLFSLGCVLYECLTGQPPFVADHIAAVLVRILFEEPLSVRELRPGIPEPVVELLGRLLAKDPARRLGDATALYALLSSLGELPEPALAATMASPSVLLQSFAENEQSLLSVVLASPPEIDEGLDATLRPQELLQSAERQALLSVLQQLGVAADFLASGALVATVQSAASATDLAVLAARAALLIKERWPGAIVTVATGRGAIRGRTAVGEVVDQAARALRSSSRSGLAKDSGAVLLDPLTARLLEGRFTQIPHPDGALLRGEARDLDTSRPLLGRPTPCVGRESELAQLESQLSVCIEEGEALAMLVTAPPGVGKSRVRHEFLRRVGKRAGVTTQLIGRGDLVHAGAPYGMLRDAIHKLCGVSGSEDLELRRERLASRIGQHLTASERERIVAFIGELSNIPFPDSGLPMLQAARQEPKIMRDCLRRALLDWLAAEVASAPVLIVLDDLQWGDELTVSVLDEALRELASTPLMILAFARPEVTDTFPRLWQQHRMQELPLRGLSRKACERLITEVLGRGLAADVVGRAINQAAGNALFLEELIRSIAEHEASEQPDTVLAMLQARIGRLVTGARRAVRAAAIFGQTFWPSGVAAVLGVPKTEPLLDSWLSVLVDAEIIQLHPTSRLSAEAEYGFRHALIRDAAYSLLTPNDLLTGHRLAGEFLERAGEQDAASVAEHFERGGEPLRAAACYARSAEVGLARGNFLGALRHVARGVSCGPAGIVLGQLRSIESYILMLLDQQERLGEVAGAAMTELPAGSLGWCRSTIPAFFAAMNHSDPSRAGALVMQVLSTEPDPDARAPYADALCCITILSSVVAPEPLLGMLLQRLAAVVMQAEPANPTIRRYYHAARAWTIYNRTEDPWGLIQESRQAAALFEQAGDLLWFEYITATTTEAGWLDLGDLDGATRRLTALSAQMAQCLHMNTVHLWRYLLARALCMSASAADWDRAETLVRPMLAHGGGLSLYPLIAQGMMARLALLRGRPEEAAVQAAATLKFLPAFPIWLARTVPVQLHALLALGRTEEAVAIAEQALGVLSSLGGFGLGEVEFRVAAAEALHDGGNVTRAHAELEGALARIQRHAAAIPDPSWRNSYLTRNPYCTRARVLARSWGLAADGIDPGSA